MTNENYDKNAYAELLRKAMGSGRSQRDFAKDAGISIPHMNKMLNGRFDAAPNKSTLRKIAKVAQGGVTFTELLKVCGYEVSPEDEKLYNIYQLYQRKIADPDKPAISIEELKELPAGTNAELIDSELYYVKPSSVTHQRIMRTLVSELTAYCAKNAIRYEVFQKPFGCNLSDEKQEVFLIPDVCVVSEPDLIRDDGISGAPDLVIELIDDQNESLEFGNKLFKYHSAGVRECIFVDTARKTVIDFDFPGNTSDFYSLSASIPVKIFDGELKLNFLDY